MAAQNWVSAMQNARQKYVNGVNAVQQSPMAAAAQNVNGYLNGVQSAVSSGKYQRGLMRVSLQDWQQAAVNLGAARLGAGATQAQPKMQAFMTQFLPFLASNVAKVKAMPKDTLEARIARSVAMQQLNAQFKRS